jgi:hypothetical protein
MAIQRLFRAAAILAFLASASACRPGASEPSEALVPTSVGVVVELEQLPTKGRTFAYRLESGATVEIDLAEADVISPPGGAGVGWLLLSGTKASGQAWIIALPSDPVAESHPGCFRLTATGIGNGAFIDMSNGLRLRKAQDFEAEIPPDLASAERYETERFSFCLNSNGEVSSYSV